MANKKPLVLGSYEVFAEELQVGDTLSTADITDSTNKRFVTDAEKASIGRGPATITYASTITPDATGSLSLKRVVATGDLTINVPTGGTDGCNLEMWITASGANRNLSVNTAVLIPGSSSITWPQNIVSGKKAKLLFQYDAVLNGGQWELTSYLPGE